MAQTQPLMAGKRGVVMGVANDRSIAWGISRVLAAHGAEIAFSYQAPQLERRVRPLAESIGASLVLHGEPVISGEVYSAVVIMVIVTTLITPPALKWTLARGEARVAPEAARRDTDAAPGPPQA